MTDKGSGELTVVGNLLLLRALVATLGERADPPWWRTQFLTDAGLRATQRIFPRTGLAAAIKSTSAAAQAEHDRLIGIGGRYHLFRLPTSLENGVAHALCDKDKLTEPGSVLSGGIDSLRATLESLSGGKRVVHAGGPISLGRSSRLDKAAGVADLAAYYHAAFGDSVRSYPYFDEVEGGK